MSAGVLFAGATERETERPDKEENAGVGALESGRLCPRTDSRTGAAGVFFQYRAAGAAGGI